MRLLSLCLFSLTTLLVVACSPESKPLPENATAKEHIVSRSFSEGQHYSVIPYPVTEPQLQRYLTEYFWLGCPHCQNFEPLLKGYLEANPSVTLVRKHPALGDRWAVDASVFYSLYLHGHEHLITALLDLYRQTRLDKSTLPDSNAINAFLAQHQIEQASFETQRNSEAVSKAMTQANREMLDNRISGVPSLVVNGKYLVNSEQPADVKTAEDYYQLLDYLLSKE